MIELWAHQKQAVELAMKSPHFAFLFEQGTGKTRAALEALRRRIAQTKSRTSKVLILAPGITLENWRHELKKYAPELAPFARIADGPGPRRVETILRAHDKNILIVSHDTLIVKGAFEALFAWKPDVLIVDESHRFKNLSAKRTKRAIQLSTLTKLRFILSGTAVTNSPLEVFAQWRILDKGATFGTSFLVFRNTYFFDQNANMPKQKYFPAWTIRPGALEAINDKLKATSLRVKKAECLDLPPLVRKEFFVELSPAQRSIYDQMKKSFVAPVSDTEAVVATLAMTRGMRLMQIASGFVATEEMVGNVKTRRVRSFEDNPRADALKELLENHCPEHKVLVWAVFTENYRTIRDTCEGLGIEAVEVTGEVTAKQKQEAIDRFNTDPKVRVLFGHPKSGGIGVNLVAASYMIFYSRSFSLEDDLQAEARNYRGGSEVHECVTRIDLIAKDTIDEVVTARLAEKEAISETVLKNLVGL
jgi:SNF2 family DNA or RNA helicase